jgi:hypothetical protein
MRESSWSSAAAALDVSTAVLDAPPPHRESLWPSTAAALNAPTVVLDAHPPHRETVKAGRCCRPVGPCLLCLSFWLLPQILSISLIFASEMYLEEELFIDFMLPTQYPIVFSLISLQQFSPHMAGTQINGKHSSARNGRHCPELPGIQDGTGCSVFCAALTTGTGCFGHSGRYRN